MKDLGARDKYFAVFNAGTFKRGAGKRGFVVVGTPTAGFGDVRDETATYNGRTVIEAYRAEGYEGVDKSMDRFRGDATLTARFASSTISGRLDNFTRQRPGQDNREPVPALRLTLPESRFDATTGFSGDLQVSGLDEGDTADLSYAGSFYGPDADSVAGTISGRGAQNGVAWTAIGWFGADKDE